MIVFAYVVDLADAVNVVVDPDGSDLYGDSDADTQDCGCFVEQEDY